MQYTFPYDAILLQPVAQEKIKQTFADEFARFAAVPRCFLSCLAASCIAALLVMIFGHSRLSLLSLQP
jgi:hypothetical protein